jgi:3-phenylpropionate/trans-cinnamate dioxygenase ferredoxin reductase component
MTKKNFEYIIIGGGLAGASAIEGIREVDADGSIALIGDEKFLPYDRPPLTKKLWNGKLTYKQVFLHDHAYYTDKNVELFLETTVKELDPAGKSAIDGAGNTYCYRKLLLAAGSRPRVLPIPGGDLEGVCYYRYLDNYRQVKSAAAPGKSAVIVGGGFIGSELAAALNINGVRVTMLFPEEHICARVFPESLAWAIMQDYANKGVEIICGDKPVSFEKEGGSFTVRTEKGRILESGILAAGIGIKPDTALASDAGLSAGDGITVNEYLQTSDPDIYAAGDCAFFPCRALGKDVRLEHWDNALGQGKHAGRNMAGAGELFEYLPYFYSDLFDFGYEAVGEVNSNLETRAFWQEENRKGVIYYLENSRVRGVMLCNVWGKLDAARELIFSGRVLDEARLRDAIPADEKKAPLSAPVPSGAKL